MKGAAIALNKFNSDGSFMEKFQSPTIQSNPKGRIWLLVYWLCAYMIRCELYCIRGGSSTIWNMGQKCCWPTECLFIGSSKAALRNPAESEERESSGDSGTGIGREVPAAGRGMSAGVTADPADGDNRSAAAALRARLMGRAPTASAAVEPTRAASGQRPVRHRAMN